MKKTSFLLFFLYLFITGCSHQNDISFLRKSFREPPQDARPYVWWHWMNGNITEDGVRKDLMWMNRAGIGGFHHFDAALSTPQIVDKRLIYMQDDWKDVFRNAIRLGDSLGMEMSIASSPGWSCTGGPWVDPSDGMKKLVWRETVIDGGKSVEVKLPDPFTVNGTFQNAGGGSSSSMVESSEGEVPEYYSAIAVLGFKIPENDLTLKEMGAHITVYPKGNPSLDKLIDGDYSTGEIFQGEGKDLWIEYSFPSEITISSASVADRGGRGQTVLESSPDGVNYTKVSDIPPAAASQVSVTFSPVRARYFRLRIGPNTGSALMAMLGRGSSRDNGSYLTEFNLYTVPRVDNFEGKAGFSTSTDDYLNTEPIQFDGIFPSPDDVVDLTSMVSTDGILRWDAPEGRWKILRLGYSLTGKRNHPAPPEATGLEVDKLDPLAWEKYFRTYIDMYIDASGGLVGKKGIKYILTDSYEAGAANWTGEMMREFKSRRGYDLLPWMPVLTGHIIGSPQRSEAFLRDWRRTLSDLIEENYDKINTILASYGMEGRYSESHETGRVVIADGMNMKRSAAVPMSAIWCLGPLAASTHIGAQADMRESSSVAHIYGGNIAAAESMTSVGLMGKAYTYCPENLKSVVDLEFASGINRIIVHESAHQPSDDKFPGLGLSVTGQWFNRHETWAEYARPWTDYIARSSYLLRQGRNVSDILVLYGEDSNITALYGDSLPDIPSGFNYDYANRDALSQMEVKDGRMIAPSGCEYRILSIGRGTGRMSVELLRKIKSLSDNGVMICGEAPIGAYCLEDSESEFLSLVGDIFNSGRTNVYPDINSAIRAEKLVPDVESETVLNFVHRSIAPSVQIYWISKPGPESTKAEVSFRCSGLRPEIWDPQTGETRDVSYKMIGDRTVLTLDLVSDDALFVVFNGKSGVKESVSPAFHVSETVAVNGEWTVKFQDGRGAPEGEVTLTEGSWTLSEDPGIKYFSGTAEYRKAITVPGLSADQRLILDLGDVKNIAEISIDGKVVSTLWKHPFRTDITSFVHEGDNILTVKVTNLWPNRLIGDSALGKDERITYTPTEFFNPSSPLLPSGIIGPVKIESGYWK